MHIPLGAGVPLNYLFFFQNLQISRFIVPPPRYLPTESFTGIYGLPNTTYTHAHTFPTIGPVVKFLE